MKPINAVLDKTTQEYVTYQCSLLLEEKNYLHLSVALDALRSLLQVMRTMFKEGDKEGEQASANRTLAVALQAKLFYDPASFFEMLHGCVRAFCSSPGIYLSLFAIVFD